MKLTIQELLILNRALDSYFDDLRNGDDPAEQMWLQLRIRRRIERIRRTA